jgi:hypothetical protein
MKSFNSANNLENLDSAAEVKRNKWKNLFLKRIRAQNARKVQERENALSFPDSGLEKEEETTKNE